jgi:hypothetical protein
MSIYMSEIEEHGMQNNELMKTALLMKTQQKWTRLDHLDSNHNK